MKKSQVAMEFLLTYGWAIAIVVVVFASLFYFGLLDAPKASPTYCRLPAGLTCLDHRYESGKFTFFMKNNLGNSIIVERIESATCDTNRPYEILDNHQAFAVTLNCIEFSGDIDVHYRSMETGLAHTGKGESGVKKSDVGSNDPPISPTTHQNYCKNANNNGLCDILGAFTSQGDYKDRCCGEWGLCCT